MYDIFGKYGPIRQIRTYLSLSTLTGDRGTAPDTRGTAFVVYDDIFDAKSACDHLQGFNVMGRYLIVLYFQASKMNKKANLQKKEEEIKELKQYPLHSVTKCVGAMASRIKPSHAYSM
jgi:pre-mRNA branch site protein p14